MKNILIYNSLILLMFSINTTADEHPDLSGVWKGDSLILPSSSDGESFCFLDCDDFEPTEVQGLKLVKDPKPEYKPEYQARVADLDKRQVTEDTVLQCMPPGVPRIGSPEKIVQTDKEIIFMYDDPVGGFFRVIPVDGRAHREDYEATYLGDAIGRWEGDTLVVETVNFNTETWISDDGAFHTENLRVVERFRKDGDTIIYDVTAYDPEVLAEPWSKTTRTLTRSEEEIYEPVPCVNDIHLQTDLDQYHTNPR